MTHHEQPAKLSGEPLDWQSRAILSGVLCLTIPWILISTLFSANGPRFAYGAGIILLLAVGAFAVRAVTPPAAVVGAVLCFSLLDCTYSSHWWHSPVVAVLALFSMTHLATRFRRDRKQSLGTSEPKTGRTAFQIAANLGVAASSMPLYVLPLWFREPGNTSAWTTFWQVSVLPATIAALAEAAADTVSSEIGQALPGEPRLLTTLKRVPPGTNGAVSLPGTVAGCVAAGVVALVSMASLGLSGATTTVVMAAAIVGLFFDSLLGATLESWGWLNNDAVNFLSTLAAALTAAMILHFR